MNEPVTIVKHPALRESQDYTFLRKQGIAYLQQLGSRLWTDYNIHDPGVTLLELLAYAITDLGHRTSFNIKDLLADPPSVKPNPQRQAFYTAREILTVNPWTEDDYRKLLIDINGIKNAWLFCKCPCEMELYANCALSKLEYEPTQGPIITRGNIHPVIIKGFYDVLVEFEEEASFGDLNSGKVKYNFSFEPAPGSFSTAAIEMRLLSWHDLELQQAKFADLRKPDSRIEKVTVKFISGNKGDNQDIPVTPVNELPKALRRPVFATIEIEYRPDQQLPATQLLTLEDVPLRVWLRSDADRKALTLPALKEAIQDVSPAGILPKYLEKIKRADEIMVETKHILHAHRNLCEDYCSIKAIEVEDIAVCADIEVALDADIEKILAEAYYLISEYFSPDIRFYTLKELLDQGVPVEDIFEGPALANGFINNEQLASTQLKTVLYTSDVINLLMDIPGVTAVKNLVLARYDKEGNLVQSESWSLKVTPQHQPRLYVEGSKFLVFKNGLPFLPDTAELSDTLQVIKGTHIQPKLSAVDNDLPVPAGVYSNLQDYYPLQYSLPLTYGVGPHGLPEHAGPARRGQAKQLKAYLLFFEQLYVNYLQQLSHIKDLFAVDEQVKHTYFSHYITEAEIKGVTGLYNSFTPAALETLTEQEPGFLDRRNRFLDHLLARFSEQFTDYALLLYAYSENRAVADHILIRDKISFLRDFPEMSRNRARSFNYKDSAHVCSTGNVAGLEKRIARLLGFRHLQQYFELFEPPGADPQQFERKWQLLNDSGALLLVSPASYKGISLEEVAAKAQPDIEQVVSHITDPARYEIKKDKKWVLTLLNAANEVIATTAQPFGKKADAEAAKAALIEFAKSVLLAEKMFIVEHMLLRPRETGDPLMSICLDPDCNLCGEEDPYSFRLTVVMNGETGIANKATEFRRFAEKTIRMETPAHIGLKICWVSNVQLEEFSKAWCEWLTELAKTQPDKTILHDRLEALLIIFEKLKSVYPQATLHDCVDGNDENRVYLNQTII